MAKLLSYLLLVQIFGISMAPLAVAESSVSSVSRASSPVTPSDYVQFGQCHGVIDGLIANVALVVEKHEGPLPVDVIEMQAELNELGWHLQLLSKAGHRDEEAGWPAKDIPALYISEYANYRGRTQSTDTVVMFVDQALRDNSKVCEGLMRKMTQHYYPQGLPRIID